MFTQQQFLGASIQSFNSSIRRGDGSAELNVVVIVDDKNGDTTPTFVTGETKIGQPVYFVYDEFSFGGILRSYNKLQDSNNNPQYSCIITDAREILSGVQIIVSEYAGPVSIPNIYNVYGYYEDISYGNSGNNDSGMPLYNVYAGLSTLVGQRPIQFRGDIAAGTVFYFGLDITELPIFSANYRISGPNITVLEFIQQVCSDSGYDFYFDLVNDIIKLKVIPRTGQTLSFTAISDYVTSIDGAMSKNEGRELRNETTSKFIVGGPRIDVYFQEYNGGTDSLANIWPFWGFDSSGKAILGTGINNDHQFTVDSRHIDCFGVGSSYTMDVAELRAAMADKSSWVNFLQIRNGVPNTPQYKRADRIGLVDALNEQILQLAGKNGGNITPAQIFSKTSKQIEKFRADNTLADVKINESIERLYQFVKAYADEYYGRKFMVNLPFSISSGVIQDQFGEYRMYRYPESSGWIDESSSSLSNLINEGYLPSEFNRYTTDEGRIRCMVGISNYRNYDFSEFSADSLILSGNTVFILCDVEVNKAVSTGDDIPKAVITLPAKITLRNSEFKMNLKEILTTLADEKGMSDEQVRELTTNSNVFSTSWAGGSAAVIPTLSILPLRHSQNTYGPWFAAGAAGKVDFEYATDLVPWNFGSEAVMNQIGNARVQTALTYLMEEESGSVIFPDVPNKKLGEQLIAGGPYITDISVTISSTGPQTTYNMRTWTPRQGQGITRANADAITKIAKSQQLARRRLRDYIKINNVPQQYYKNRSEILNQALKKNSSNAVKSIKTVGVGTDKTSSQDVSTTNYQDSVTNIGYDYQATAIMSMDGNDAAYSTSPVYAASVHDDLSTPVFPHFKEIDEDAAPTKVVTYRSELDPFKGDHDIQMLTTGTEMPKDGLTDTTSDEYRAIGNRAPVMMVGYGRDSFGFPYPNKYDDEDSPSPTDVDSYATNHKKRREKWFAAPLDLYYDEERDVCYSSPVILEGYLTEDLDVYPSGNPPSGTTANMDVYRYDPRNNVFEDSGEDITVTNRSQSLSASSGVYIQVRRIGNEYRPFWVDC